MNHPAANLLDLAGAKQHPYVLLDACVLINEWNRAPAVLHQFSRGQLRASVLTLWEFLHGAAGASLARDVRGARRTWLDDRGVVVVPLSAGASRTFASLINDERCPPSAVDCLLAAESLARKWPFVTANGRHFEGVTGLRLVAV